LELSLNASTPSVAGFLEIGMPLNPSNTEAVLYGFIGQMIDYKISAIYLASRHLLSS
jgi:hypothetical protein